MREHPQYRLNLELIQAKTNKLVLSVSEAASVTGKSRDWVYDHIRTKDGTITTVSLAMQLAEM